MKKPMKKPKKPMKADVKGAPSGSDYPKGSFGKGKITDKGMKK